MPSEEDEEDERRERGGRGQGVKDEKEDREEEEGSENFLTAWQVICEDSLHFADLENTVELAPLEEIPRRIR